MMPGFGIVIINDVSGSSYENLYSALDPKITFESSAEITSPECYNEARSMIASMISLALLSIILF